jgi:hypothetical protein
MRWSGLRRGWTSTSGGWRTTPSCSDASPAYWAGYRDAHAIAEKAPEEACLRGIIAYATGQQIQPTFAGAGADSFRAAHAAFQRRLGV